MAVLICVFSIVVGPCLARAQVSLFSGPAAADFTSPMASNGVFGGAWQDVEESLGLPTVSFGWLGDRNGTTISFEAQGPGLEQLTSIVQRYDNFGLCIALSQSLRLNQDAGFSLGGWYQIPVDSTSEESNQVAGSPAGRTWHTESEWWGIEAAASYAIGGTRLLGGFRYDRYGTLFTNPEDVVGGLPSQSSNAADVTFQTVMPYIGLQSEYAAGATIMKARLIGFWDLYGSVEYAETVSNAPIWQSRISGSGNYDSGWFLEGALEYSRQLFGNGHLGIYAGYTIIQAKADLDLDLFSSNLNTEVDEFRLNLRRSAWSVGCNASIDLGSPFGW